jgi:hypothetical protein
MGTFEIEEIIGWRNNKRASTSRKHLLANNWNYENSKKRPVKVQGGHQVLKEYS